MPPYLSNIDIEFRGLQGGQNTVTYLDYHREAVVPSMTAAAAALVCQTMWQDIIQLAVSESFTLIEIFARLHQFTTVNEVEEYVLPMMDNGALPGHVMPPNVTVSMSKRVDNTTKWPLSADDFRNGKVGWSGVAEEHQDNGLLNAAGFLLWDDVADAIKELWVDIGGTPTPWVLGLSRPSAVPGPPEKVLVSQVVVRQKLGTQNTRKR